MPKVNTGFTLIELLISVSILVIITAASIPNFSSFIDNQNLKQAQEQVKNGVRDAQNRAISGIDSSGTYKYWVIRFDNASETYLIGKTVDTSSCTLETTDFVSNALQGKALFNVAPTPACIFYKMLSGEETTDINLVEGNKVIIKYKNSCKAVEVNHGGMIKGVDATCP